MQTGLDAATVDRCDFVENCCPHALCLTEAMQQHGVFSFSLLRTDGVGNHDPWTREKLLGCFSEERPGKAWFELLVVASHDSSTRCNLRARQMFRQFFLCAAAQNWPHPLGTASEMWRLELCRALEHLGCPSDLVDTRTFVALLSCSWGRCFPSEPSKQSKKKSIARKSNKRATFNRFTESCSSQCCLSHIPAPFINVGAETDRWKLSATRSSK